MITDNSVITIKNSSFQCNRYQSPQGLVLPFFDTNSTNITIQDILTSNCSFQCLDNTLALNPQEILPCVSCGIGNGSSVNFICQPCPANSYSGSGVCTACPSYSSQPETGQWRCKCFSSSYVGDNNPNQCNYEVWGIVVGLVYFVVLIAVIWFKRPKKYSPIE